MRLFNMIINFINTITITLFLLMSSLHHADFIGEPEATSGFSIKF